MPLYAEGHDAMKMKRKTCVELMLASVALASCLVACRRAPTGPDVGDFTVAQLSFINLAFEIAPILKNEAVTNMAGLASEYQRRHPNRLPIFMTRSNFPSGGGELRELPVRDYFCLSNWHTNDAGMTPILWGHFKLPNEVVLYLARDGSEQCVTLAEFSTLVGALSNRVEKATLINYEQAEEEKAKPR